jgi:hypothetical protein
MDWIFYALIATVVFYLVSTPILVANIGERFPEFHKSLGGDSVFFNPFKQLDLLWWIINRRYAVGSDRSFHRFDLYLANLALFVLLAIAFAVWG